MFTHISTHTQFYLAVVVERLRCVAFVRRDRTKFVLGSTVRGCVRKNALSSFEIEIS